LNVYRLYPVQNTELAVSVPPKERKSRIRLTKDPRETARVGIEVLVWKLEAIWLVDVRKGFINILEIRRMVTSLRKKDAPCRCEERTTAPFIRSTTSRMHRCVDDDHDYLVHDDVIAHGWRERRL
jgi:hypothetical protein